MASASELDRAISTRRSKLQLLTVEQLMEESAPSWLIKPLFELGTLVVLYGASASGKTFTALDWALSVATGREWMGCPTAQGPVVYIVGEGGRSARKRIAAWMRHNNRAEIPNAFVLLEAVQLLDRDDMNKLLAELQKLRTKPSLVVFDTLARCFLDGDENYARDIGRLVHAAGDVQQQTGATVLLVHHTGKQAKSTERGSNALRGAADTMVLQVKDNRNIITISNNKQKDHDEFKPITARLKTITLQSGDDGEPVTSCVLEPSQPSRSVLTAGPATRALSALDAFPDGMASSTAWRKAIEKETKQKVPEKTFHNWRRGLLPELVESVHGRKNHYRITEKGREVAASAMALP